MCEHKNTLLAARPTDRQTGGKQLVVKHNLIYLWNIMNIVKNVISPFVRASELIVAFSSCREAGRQKICYKNVHLHKFKYVHTSNGVVCGRVSYHLCFIFILIYGYVDM